MVPWLACVSGGMVVLFTGMEQTVGPVEVNVSIQKVNFEGPLRPK